MLSSGPLLSLLVCLQELPINQWIRYHTGTAFFGAMVFSATGWIPDDFYGNLDVQCRMRRLRAEKREKEDRTMCDRMVMSQCCRCCYVYTRKTKRWTGGHLNRFALILCAIRGYQAHQGGLVAGQLIMRHPVRCGMIFYLGDLFEKAGSMYAVTK